MDHGYDKAREPCGGNSATSPCERPYGAAYPIAEQGSLPEWSGQGWPEAITE